MKPSLFVAALLALSSPLLQAAQSDYFLKIDGIKGESADSAHTAEIEVSSFSWGVSNSSTIAGGGGTAGKASFQDIHFTIALDKSSPTLFLRCADGQHIPTATLYVRKPSTNGTTGQEFFKIEMKEVLISSYQVSTPPPTSGTAAGAPQQAISINYGTIHVEHTAADGTVTRFGWDVKANIKA
ncbi:MAG: type VI secretion system tube protein Hcp [Verrucomicrobiota bacterium]